MKKLIHKIWQWILDGTTLDEKVIATAKEAKKRVKIGILLNTIIEGKELKPDAEKVKELIQERAKNYKDPEQVINYFYSDEQQLKNIQSISLEEQVVDLLFAEAKAKEESITYEECVSGNQGT